MSKFSIVLFDKKPPARFLTLWEDFLKRIKKWSDLKVYLLSPSSLKDEEQARKKDFDTYSQHKAFDKCNVVVLDEKGSLWTTKKLSQNIEQWEQSQKPVTFVIGPSYGLDQRWKEKQFLALSLSPLTFPHDFAQILFLEQFYRAYSIIKKHPYHCSH